MKGVGLLLFILLQFNHFVLAAESCTTKTMTVEMPPARSQGSTDYCYGFSALAVIEHHNCKAKQPPCQFAGPRDDRLSVLDVIATANYGSGGLVAGGSVHDTLEEVRRQGAVALEACAPFAPLLNAVSSDDGKEKISFAQAVLRAQKKVSDKSCALTERTSVAAQLKEQSQLGADIDQILSALAKKDGSIALKEVLVPEKCERQRVKIRDYNIRQDKNSNFEMMRAKIIEQLRPPNQRPLISEVCRFPPTQKQKASDKCGLHVLVISGIREHCCNGICTYEYQFYDSANTFSEAEISKDGWVPESTYSERLTRKWQNTSARENLTWIE